MTIIGTLGKAVVPTGQIIGPAGSRPIPITSFQSTMTIGSIPTCNVGIPAEFMGDFADAQTNQIYTVMVGTTTGASYTIFQGYINGEHGRVTTKEITDGISLIHVARDMDQMSISVPSMHPAHIYDWAYIIQGDGTSESAAKLGFLFGSQNFFQGGNLPSQIIDGLKDLLNNVVATNITTDEKEDLQPCIDLLGKLIFLNGTVYDQLTNSLSSDDDNSINQFCRESIKSSFNAQRSVWDSLTAIFANFGMFLLCDQASRVFITADCASMKPPDGNTLDSSYIISHDRNSEFMRNIGRVSLISPNAVVSDTTSSQGAATQLAVYPTSGSQSSGGATMAILLPGWLNPIATQAPDNESGKGEPPSVGNINPSNPAPNMAEIMAQAYPDVLKTHQAYAQMCYYQEKNKLRTFAATGPLAPHVVPGTTAMISPWSAVKAISGGQLADINNAYYGYCYQISHMIDVASCVMQTTFFFRNVSNIKNAEILPAHPIFSDMKPFVWQ